MIIESTLLTPKINSMGDIELSVLDQNVRTLALVWANLKIELLWLIRRYTPYTLYVEVIFKHPDPGIIVFLVKFFD